MQLLKLRDSNQRKRTLHFLTAKPQTKPEPLFQVKFSMPLTPLIKGMFYTGLWNRRDGLTNGMKNDSVGNFLSQISHLNVLGRVRTL